MTKNELELLRLVAAVAARGQNYVKGHRFNMKTEKHDIYEIHFEEVKRILDGVTPDDE